MSGRLPGFSAEADVYPSGVSHRGGIVRAAAIPSVVARILVPGYGCTCRFGICCCVWSPGGTIQVCCPQNGSRACETWTEPDIHV